MKHLILALLAWGLLCAASPVPVRIEPQDPLLGMPVEITLELPDPETELAGLPELAPFELLAPPWRQGRELHLLLLPLRPGSYTLPPFSLHQGPSRQLKSPPLAVEIDEGVPETADIASLKEITRTPTSSTGSWLAALGLGALLLLRRRLRQRHRPPRVPSLSELSGQALLTALQRHIERDGTDDDSWREFARQVEEARFCAVEVDEGRAQQLLAVYLRLVEASP